MARRVQFFSPRHEASGSVTALPGTTSRNTAMPAEANFAIGLIKPGTDLDD